MGKDRYRRVRRAIREVRDFPGRAEYDATEPFREPPRIHGRRVNIPDYQKRNIVLQARREC